MDSPKVAIPNFFYDLIVFVSPSILLMFGLAVGLKEKMGADLTSKLNLGAIDFLAVIFAILFIAYEYGRLTEALSHFFVSRPIKHFIRFMKRLKVKKFENTDYSLDLTKEVEHLNVPHQFEELRKGSKWTIYFYALLYAPNIGRDLLKRYAWEKLSRSSAFTFFLLLVISTVVMLLNKYYEAPILSKNFSLGSIEFTLATIIMSLFTYYEYYRRNSWNNDLLTKVTPILILAKEKGVQASELTLKLKKSK